MLEYIFIAEERKKVNSMKKENGKIKKLLLLGGLAILLTIGIATYARYSSSVTGTGTANVALYTNDATFTIPADSIPSQPGETSTIDFSVTNTKENKTAEVAQTYPVSYTHLTLPTILRV